MKSPNSRIPDAVGWALLIVGVAFAAYVWVAA